MVRRLVRVDGRDVELAAEDGRRLLVDGGDHLVDDRHEVERDLVAARRDVGGLVLEDEDRPVMGAGDDLPPEVLERVALQELEHLAPDEVLHGTGERGREDLCSLWERVRDDLLRVDRLGELIGEVRGELALDLRILSDRDDDALEVAAVEDLVLPPDADRGQQQEQARQGDEDAHTPAAQSPAGVRLLRSVRWGPVVRGRRVGRGRPGCRCSHRSRTRRCGRCRGRRLASRRRFGRRRRRASGLLRGRRTRGRRLLLGRRRRWRLADRVVLRGALAASGLGLALAVALVCHRHLASLRGLGHGRAFRLVLALVLALALALALRLGLRSRLDVALLGVRLDRLLGR